MRFRTMLAALLAVTALTAVAAAGAQAAPHWKINGEGWTTTESVKAEKHPGTALVFHSELLSLKVTVTAGQVACEGCTITKGGVASAGKLKFTEATVDINEVAAPKCSVNGGTIPTEALVDNLVMDGEAVLDKFEPAAGATGKFTTLTFSGSECPLTEASAQVTGTLCGQAVGTEPKGVFVGNRTVQNGSPEVLRGVQTLRFGPAYQTTGGCSLLLGKKEAQLTADIDNKLSGANASQPFGAGE